jgi:hypothetical protein
MVCVYRITFFFISLDAGNTSIIAIIPRSKLVYTWFLCLNKLYRKNGPIWTRKSATGTLVQYVSRVWFNFVYGQKAFGQMQKTPILFYSSFTLDFS